MKRLHKLTHAVRQHSRIEMKKARGFEAPGKSWEITNLLTSTMSEENILVCENAGVRPAADEGRETSMGRSFDGPDGQAVTAIGVYRRLVECAGGPELNWDLSWHQECANVTPPPTQDALAVLITGRVPVAVELCESPKALQKCAALADDSPGGRAHQSGGAPNSGGTLRGVARK